MAPLGLMEKWARLDDLESQNCSSGDGKAITNKKSLSSNAILPGNEPRQMELGWLGDSGIKQLRTSEKKQERKGGCRKILPLKNVARHRHYKSVNNFSLTHSVFFSTHISNTQLCSALLTLS